MARPPYSRFAFSVRGHYWDDTLLRHPSAGRIFTINLRAISFITTGSEMISYRLMPRGIWYPRQELHLHCLRSKRSFSAVGILGHVVRREGVEPPMFTLRVVDLQSTVFATGHTDA